MNKATKIGSSSSTASLRKKSFTSTASLDYGGASLLEQLDEDYRRYNLLEKLEVALKKQLNDISTMNGNDMVKDSGGDNKVQAPDDSTTQKDVHADPKE